MTTRAHSSRQVTPEQIDQVARILVDVCQELLGITPTIEIDPEFMYQDDPEGEVLTMVTAHLRGELQDWRLLLPAVDESGRRLAEAGLESNDQAVSTFIHTL